VREGGGETAVVGPARRPRPSAQAAPVFGLRWGSGKTEVCRFDDDAPYGGRVLASCTSLDSALAAYRLLAGAAGDAQRAEGEGVGSGRPR